MATSVGLESQLDRLEKMTEEITNRRISEYNNSPALIITTALADLGYGTAITLLIWMLLIFWANIDRELAIKISASFGYIISVLLFSVKILSDEWGLLKLASTLGRLSATKEIAILQNTIVKQSEQLELAGQVDKTMLVAQIGQFAKAYYVSGTPFPHDTDAFRYLYSKGLAKIDKNGDVILDAKDLNELGTKLKTIK